MVKKRVVCIYPKKDIKYDILIDYTKELTFKKIYDAELLSSNVIRIKNENGEFKKYSGNYFITYEIYENLTTKEIKKYINNVLNDVFKEKYSDKKYDFKYHEVIKRNTKLIENTFIDFIINDLYIDSHSKVLEIELNSSMEIDVLLYGNKNNTGGTDYIWSDKSYYQTLLKSEKYKMYLKVKNIHNNYFTLLKRRNKNGNV